MKRWLFTIIFLMLPVGIYAQSDSAAQTEEPEADHPNGIVRVRVLFLETGEIGDVSVKEVIPADFPSEFVEQAIAAAKKIKFEPRTIDGNAVKVARTFEYKFNKYYEEDSPFLGRTAVIKNQPKPKFPKGGLPANADNKVTVEVVLEQDGSVRVSKIETDLPETYKKAAEQAALKIKFDPAIHINGSPVQQTKTIIYEVNRK